MIKRLIKKISRVVTGDRSAAPSKPVEPKTSSTPSPKKVHSQAEASSSVQPDKSVSKPQKDNGSERSPTPTGSKPKRRRPRKPAWNIKQFQVPEKEDETRFHDVNLPDPIMHAIADLGFEYCTPIQAKTLIHATAGQNVAGRAQTGTGKTAAFLISIFTEFLKNPISGKRPLGTPRALVLAPTRELVIQIADDAQLLSKYCDFNCFAIYGGMDLGKQKEKLHRHPVDMIVATPGRLLDFASRKDIDLKQVEVLVIDEADRMLDMGFIPDVKRIVRQTPPKSKRRTMLFSATLTEDVMRLASQWMPDPVICEMSPEQVTVDTVDQVIYIVTANQKFKVLYHLLQQRNAERVLIFCNRRDRSQRLVHRLEEMGISSELLSGAVPQKKRLKILEGFKEGTIKVVVATDVAGRGLHVKDIGLVVNYEFPYDPEDYVHRIGRTGRAGVEGTAVSFACEDESFIIPEIEKYIGRDLPCIMPDEELLVTLPPSKKIARPRNSTQDASSGPQRRRNRTGRGGSGGRGGGNRGRKPSPRTPRS